MSQTAHGIDISKWQGAIDCNAIAAAHAAGQVDFIIMRAGYGYATTDPRFEEYYREATSRGIPCGARAQSSCPQGVSSYEQARVCRECPVYPVFPDRCGNDHRCQDFRCGRGGSESSRRHDRCGDIEQMAGRFRDAEDIQDVVQ